MAMFQQLFPDQRKRETSYPLVVAAYLRLGRRLHRVNSGVNPRSLFPLRKNRCHCVTVCVIAVARFGLKLGSPEYEVVIVWVPTLRPEVVRVAMPPLSGTVPRSLLPVLNVMVPVGVPELKTVADTVAVNVTGLSGPTVVDEDLRETANQATLTGLDAITFSVGWSDAGGVT